jgi:uncharacterized RDD family membrane protein YckC
VVTVGRRDESRSSAGTVAGYHAGQLDPYREGVLGSVINQQGATMDIKLPNGENPYAPPSSDVNAGTLPEVEGEIRLADRGTRLVAAIVDGLLYMVVLIPVFILIFTTGAVQEGSSTALFSAFVAGPLGFISLFSWLALLGFQAYLISVTGQSIAKRVFKIRIVKMDGSKVNFVSGVLVRNWLMMVLQQIPVLNMFLPLLDALFIFRQDRRCIHDLIAGTKVINIA